MKEPKVLKEELPAWLSSRYQTTTCSVWGRPLAFWVLSWSLQGWRWVCNSSCLRKPSTRGFLHLSRLRCRGLNVQPLFRGRLWPTEGFQGSAAPIRARLSSGGPWSSPKASRAQTEGCVVGSHCPDSERKVEDCSTALAGAVSHASQQSNPDITPAAVGPGSVPTTSSGPWTLEDACKQ